MNEIRDPARSGQAEPAGRVEPPNIAADAAGTQTPGAAAVLRGRGRVPGRRGSAGRPADPWWRRCLGFSAATAVVVGILWFLIAPGGAVQGDRNDFNSWFARDAVLGMLLAAAGVATAAHAMMARHRATRAAPDREENHWAFAAVVALAAMLGAIVAWRTGVFAGDLFQSPPVDMANPSMVFSLRSGAALLLWPLASMLVVFFWSMLSPPAAEPVP